MPEPLAIPDREILARLRACFDLDADALEFLRIGNDADAWRMNREAPACMRPSVD